MTVRELIAELRKVKDKDRIVVLQRDPEGNGYGPLDGTDDNAMWWEEEGEIGKQKLTKADKADGFCEDDVLEPDDGIVPALVLWPSR